MLTFSKYQGLGNDFILMEGRSGQLPAEVFSPDPDWVQRICDRRFGIGGDGLILALPPQGDAELRMRIFNADGSEAEMCGNGIRCLARFLADSDGDGFGDSETSMAGCSPMDGYVDDDTDCDDTDATVYPEATELCDGLDNDCNELVDDDATETWYFDGDEDSYGDSSISYEGCDPPSGYVRSGGDCDDDDEFLSPVLHFNLIRVIKS